MAAQRARPDRLARLSMAGAPGAGRRRLRRRWPPALDFAELRIRCSTPSRPSGESHRRRHLRPASAAWARWPTMSPPAPAGLDGAGLDPEALETDGGCAQPAARYRGSGSAGAAAAARRAGARDQTSAPPRWPTSPRRRPAGVTRLRRGAGGLLHLQGRARPSGWDTAAALKRDPRPAAGRLQAERERLLAARDTARAARVAANTVHAMTLRPITSPPSTT